MNDYQIGACGLIGYKSISVGDHLKACMITLTEVTFAQSINSIITDTLVTEYCIISKVYVGTTHLECIELPEVRNYIIHYEDKLYLLNKQPHNKPREYGLRYNRTLNEYKNKIIVLSHIYGEIQHKYGI